MRFSFESPESSTPIITRSVAAALDGQFSDSYPLPNWQKAALEFLGTFPQNAARWVISRFESLSGLDRAVLEDFSIDSLVQERLADYSRLPGPFPCVTVGAGLGGATAHLAHALGGPFLPQAFVLTLKGGAPDGSIQTYLNRSADLAQRIARANPGILTIQHYDPIHDEWMTRFVNHLRFKLLDLPQAYASYLRRVLEPGGAVCYLDCQAQWLRYRIAERSVFQVGGWGDISAQEFIQGSPRIEAYRRRMGLRQDSWSLPDYPLESGPESEWGSEPGLDEALEEFCRQHEYRFVRIRLPEPHDYSRLALSAVQALLNKESRSPAGVLVEMFSQFDAHAVSQSGLLPLWLVFNTRDSLEFMKSMRPIFPPDKPVFFSPLATFTHTPDMTPWQDWERALDGLDWRNIGARSNHYPADARALVHWADPLRQWVNQHPSPIRERLQVEELQAIAGRMEND